VKDGKPKEDGHKTLGITIDKKIMGVKSYLGTAFGARTFKSVTKHKPSKGHKIQTSATLVKRG
jgi:hypothetical protein